MGEVQGAQSSRWCGDTWAHLAHLDRRTGTEFQCGGYAQALASPEGHQLFMTVKKPGQSPTADDVNDQHLAAMGLAEQSLGESYVPTKTRQGDQVLPTGGGQCVQDLVIAEMEESKRVGLERYGSVLRTFNGRKSIQDVAEEVRDLHVYLTQVRAEAEADRDTLVEIATARVVQEYQRMTTEEVVDSPEGFSARFAEVAVDAVMGWVVGKTMGRFIDGEEVAQLLDEAWPTGGGRAAIIECLAHAMADRLGLPERKDHR